MLAFLKGGLARLLFLHALLLEEDLALAFFEFDLEQVQQRRVESILKFGDVKKSGKRESLALAV